MAEYISPVTEQFSLQNTQSKPALKRKTSDDPIARKGCIATICPQNMVFDIPNKKMVYSSDCKVANIDNGYDTEKNDYTLEELDKDITKREESKSFCNTMDALMAHLTRNHPEKIMN